MKTNAFYSNLILLLLLPLLTLFTVQLSSYANNAPVFTDGDSTTRVVRENTAADENIGDAVTATDDDDDTLTYSLAGTDASQFNINTTTGQIQTKEALDYEETETYSITITVSDGNEGSDTINVTINVKDVVDVYTPLSQRTPQVASGIVRRVSSARTTEDVGDKDLTQISRLNLNDKDISELKNVDFDGITSLNTVNLSDNDLTTLPSNLFKGTTQLKYLFLSNNSISRLPADIFKGLSQLRYIVLWDNRLTNFPNNTFQGLTSLVKLDLRHNPRYNKSLELPISFQKVDDGVYKAIAPNGATFDMTIPVSITNGYMSNGATSITIQQGNIASSENIIILRTPGTTDTITLNYGSALPALPSNHYGYGFRKGSDIPMDVEEYGGTPTFADGRTTTRSVRENAADANVGEAVSATIPNSNNALSYTLSGTDAETFIINSSGQIKTAEALDYETKNSYAVTVTATEDSTAVTGSIDVTINVTDVNEAPVFAAESVTLSYDEDTDIDAGYGKNVGEPITATDPDARTTLSYSLGGTNAGKFEIIRSTGQIKTDAYLNYEQKKSYSVTVTASDNGTPKKTASIDVTINIKDVLDKYRALHERTSEVADAIVKELSSVEGSDVESADDVNDTHLNSLTSLTLSNKSIESLKDLDFSGLSALETLKLDGNSLTSLPRYTFVGLSALKTLDLSSNNITSLNGEIFDNLSKLTDLDLSSNSLSSFPGTGSTLFSETNDLENLNLSSNKFRSLPLNVFHFTKKLKNLDVSSNSISEMDGRVLTGLSKLENVNFSNNLLESLPNEIFKGLHSLETANFSDNPTDPLLVVMQIKIVDGGVVVDTPIGSPSSTTVTVDIQKGTGHYVRGEYQSYGNRVAVDLGVGKTQSGVIRIKRTPGEENPVLVGIYRDPAINNDSTGLRYKKANWYRMVDDVEEGVYDGPIYEDDTGKAPNNAQQIPETTAFLPNYPNPFNPETWIPFHLAKPADVTLTIYNMRGIVVRKLVLGYQPSGYYQSRARAAYWDGRNTLGERVSTGLYFCTFQAGDFTATRKMLIRK